MSEVDELYVMARRVLLDALEALGSHRTALVLVGAQALYLHVGESDLAVAPFTTDGDLAIDPGLLAEIPPLEQALLAAGFSPKAKDSVGVWIAKRSTSQQVPVDIPIDLLVPASVSPGKGRAARLLGHDIRAARSVNGLEGAIVDVDDMRLEALEASDIRSVEVRVAGPAALLVAKVHKINDRLGTARQTDKDALDVFRLLRSIDTDDLAARYERLLADHRSMNAANVGRGLLTTQFATRNGPGIEMAIRSMGVLGDADEMTQSCLALARDLLTALNR